MEAHSSHHELQDETHYCSSQILWSTPSRVQTKTRQQSKPCGVPSPSPHGRSFYLMCSSRGREEAGNLEARVMRLLASPATSRVRNAGWPQAEESRTGAGPVRLFGIQSVLTTRRTHRGFRGWPAPGARLCL